MSAHEAARVVLQVSEPPMALQPLGGSVVWDGFPAIPFRGADPTRLRIYFGEQLPRDVLMPATDRSPRCSGGSTSAMPRVFRNQFLSLVTLSFVPSPPQLTKRTDHFRYMIHGEKRVQNRRTGSRSIVAVRGRCGVERESTTRRTPGESDKCGGIPMDSLITAAARTPRLTPSSACSRSATAPARASRRTPGST